MVGDIRLRKNVRGKKIIRSLNAKLVSFFCIFLLLICWFLISKDSTPWVMNTETKNSRFVTLERVIIAANNGYYYQLEPGKPMEHAWEDPGIGFLTVTWGLIKRTLGIGLLNPYKDPFIIEFIIILMIFSLLYNKTLFKLPKWFYLGLPVLVLLLVLPFGRIASLFLNVNFSVQGRDIASQNLNHGLLYLSIMTHWAKILGAVWTTAITLQIVLWYRSFRHGEVVYYLTVRYCFRIIVYGFVLGLIASIRKDVFGLAFLAISVITFYCLLNEFRQSSQKVTGLTKRVVVFFIITMLLVIIGNQTYKGFIKATWMVRDTIYEMDNSPRIYGHPTWHVLYISLGFVPNKLGIEWKDEVGWEHVSQIPGNEKVQYGTKNHEKASRKLFFNTLKENPDLLLRNILAKIKSLISNMMILILMIFVCLALSCIFILNQSNWWICGLLLSNLLVYATLPIIIHPSILFCLDFITSGFWIISVALIFMSNEAVRRFGQKKSK